MPAFPTYDPKTDSVHLNGTATILLTLLMKSKFGERFDPETLFHTRLADLLDQLQSAAGYPRAEPGACFSKVNAGRWEKRIPFRAIVRP